MKFDGRKLLQKAGRLLISPGLEPAQQAARIQAFEKDIVLPIKALVALILFYYFFLSQWLDRPPAHLREVAFQMIRWGFLTYVGINIIQAAILLRVRRISLPLMQWMIYTTGLLDGVIFAALTFVTGGFDSFVFWMFPALILRNALSVPNAAPQIVLNLAIVFSYVLAGIFDVVATQDELEFLSRVTLEELGMAPPENSAEPFVMRIFILVLWTFCCYGVQALYEKHRRALEEAVEFATRQEQLQTAGRLAAEIAHRIKNPLSIINNSAFSLERSLRDGRNSQEAQLGIIREEVAKADRILTELMGYAQLAEGRVEKLNVAEELDRAISNVLPPAAKFEVAVTRDYDAELPHLLMQRGHLSEIFTNILQNAREAIHGSGKIEVTARHGEDFSVVVTITDNGPGIPPDKKERIFEAYFSTKEKGTGLGLSIVKHNIEMYGGKVVIESSPGQGAKFILQLPTKSVMKFTK